MRVVMRRDALLCVAMHCDAEPMRHDALIYVVMRPTCAAIGMHMRSDAVTVMLNNAL